MFGCVTFKLKYAIFMPATNMNITNSSSLLNPQLDDGLLCDIISEESGDEENSLSELDPTNNRPHFENNLPCVTTWKRIWKNVTIEPIMFAHMFSMSISGVVLQNLYIQRICIVTLATPHHICKNLGNYTELEQQIDGIAATYATYRSLIESVFPIFISLFLGPWSEIHGTKWTMLLPLFGYFLSATSYLIFCYVPSASPELLLVSSLPIALVGGMVSIVMSAFSLISKKTNLENRSFRVAMLEVSWVLGGPLGTFGGGLIYKYGSFTAVFSTSATLFLSAFIYGCFMIREEIPVVEDRNCFVDMFNVKAVKDIFGTVLVKRTGLKRRWLIFMLATIFLRIIAMFGYLSNMYLYTRRRFQWDLKQYTDYTVSDSFIFIAGGYIMIMICLKMLKLADPIIGILSTIGILTAQFVFAFAVSGWMIYLGASLQIFSGMISIILRSMISKVVAKEEIVKIFTFLACGEAIMPIIGGPLYSVIFSYTLTTFPGAMFMVSAIFYVAILTNFIYLYLSMRNKIDHEEIQNQTAED